MEISVVICTWNNCDRLALTLDAISRCAVPPALKWELVVVDNNCTDGTPTVCRKLKERLPLVYTREPLQGLSRAKNKGLRAARGRLIVFGDDDITPSRSWLTSYRSAYGTRPIGFYFGGPLDCEYETREPAGALRGLAAYPVTGLDWGLRERELAPTERLLGANWACPTDALAMAGDYDESLGLDASLGRRRVGEEWDMANRLQTLGLRPWYLPQARVTHWVPDFKCQIGHIAENFEAHGAYSIHTSTVTPILGQHSNLARWCRVPCEISMRERWRAAVATAFTYLRWACENAFGRTAYRSYAEFRFCLGRLRELRRLNNL